MRRQRRKRREKRKKRGQAETENKEEEEFPNKAQLGTLEINLAVGCVNTTAYSKLFKMQGSVRTFCN
jgi:hypothetical protein